MSISSNNIIFFEAYRQMAYLLNATDNNSRFNFIWQRNLEALARKAIKIGHWDS